MNQLTETQKRNLSTDAFIVAEIIRRCLKKNDLTEDIKAQACYWFSKRGQTTIHDLSVDVWAAEINKIIQGRKDMGVY